MHVIGIDRVIIATPDLNETMGQFADLLGLSFSDVLEPTTDTQSGEQNVANVLSPSGIELVTPRDDGNEVARFIEENGPGLYAVSLRVTDLDEAMAELEAHGVEAVGHYDHGDFAETFYHPAEFGGAFVILAEYEAPHPAVVASQ